MLYSLLLDLIFFAGGIINRKISKLSTTFLNNARAAANSSFAHNKDIFSRHVSKFIIPTLNRLHFLNISFNIVIFKISASTLSTNFSKLSQLTFRNSTLSDIDCKYSILTKLNFLSGSKILHSTFNHSTFNNCKFINCIIDNVDFSNTQFINCTFRGCTFSNISFNTDSHFLPCVLPYTKFINPSFHSCSIRDPFFSYFIAQTIHNSVSYKHDRLFYVLFNSTTCLGTSFRRLSFFIITTWFFFGFLYSIPTSFSGLDNFHLINMSSLAIDWGKHVTSTSTISPITPYYFSLITLTTLGYGDIHPLGDIVKILCAVEALFGYLFLGLFTSLILNKMTRFS